MLRNRLIIALLAAMCLFSLLCTRSDVITGAGYSVVTEMDSTLTGLRRGFVRVDLDASATDTAFSLPAAADPAFSTHITATGGVPVGVNADGDTLAAHATFQVVSFAGASSPPYTGSNATLDRVTVYFRKADTLGAANPPIPVFESDTLRGVMPVNREGAGAQIGELAFGDGNLDSIEITDETVKQRIFNTRISSEADTFLFAYGIVGYHGDLRLLGVPYVIAHVTRNGRAVRDSLPGLARFTAFENAEAVPTRATFPYSSFHTKRTAVFRISVDSIFARLKLGGAAVSDYELLNAVLSVAHNRPETPPDSGSSASGDAFNPNLNPVQYRIVSLSYLLTDEFPPDDEALAASRSLRDQFAIRTSVRPARTGSNVHSVKSALQSVINDYNAGGSAGGNYIYVYLRPVEENGMMMWQRPPKLETVFTPSRSQ